MRGSLAAGVMLGSLASLRALSAAIAEALVAGPITAATPSAASFCAAAEAEDESDLSSAWSMASRLPPAPPALLASSSAICAAFSISCPNAAACPLNGASSPILNGGAAAAEGAAGAEAAGLAEAAADPAPLAL